MDKPEWEPIHEVSGSDRCYHIRPDNVPTDGESSDLSTFGTAEVEEIAGHLIKFFKLRGYWCSFTIDELSRFYREHNWDPNLMFYGLMGAYLHFGGGPFVGFYDRGEPLLVCDAGGNYNVTNLFIERCCRNMKKKKVA